MKEASKYFNKNGLFYRIVINSSNNSEGKKFKFGDNSDKILHILKNCVDRIQSKFPNITFNGA
ncbi:hypothetical protein, partial [Staphylococcus pseudintermedius]|uniref:hypothetical protein n=1 Tax=Staphylococcus pseudintermedius TaxID=283734 RepID=UPI0036F2DB41